MCGENSPSKVFTKLGEGSSPRVRGKLLPFPFEGTDTGLIPACAGKTPLSSELIAPTAAHPRVCGENEGPLLLFRAIHGSSPRVRGKRHWSVSLSSRGGLIPACAGKT